MSFLDIGLRNAARGFRVSSTVPRELAARKNKWDCEYGEHHD